MSAILFILRVVRTPFVAVTLSLVLALAGSQAARAEGAYYVLSSQINLPMLLPPPPAGDSEAERRDLQAVLDAQATRTEAQVARAKATANLSVFTFSDVLGPSFDAEKLPKTDALFKRIVADGRAVMAAGKTHWSRPRPFLVSAKVSPAANKPKSHSYPSGNALFGRLYAIVLSEMLPEKATELFRRGDETGDNRVIVGVHFPTDLAAGRETAMAIAVLLATNPTYQADFAAAKAEVRAALGL